MRLKSSDRIEQLFMRWSKINGQWANLSEKEQIQWLASKFAWDGAKSVVGEQIRLRRSKINGRWANLSEMEQL